MIIFSDGVLADLEKIFDFNAARDLATAPDHISRIQSAVTVLEAHPEIGRKVSLKSDDRHHGRLMPRGATAAFSAS